MKLESKCPECSNELRREYYTENDRGKVTGFCSKCLKNYDICMAVNHMAPCILMKRHSNYHIDYNGLKF